MVIRSQEVWTDSEQILHDMGLIRFGGRFSYAG